MWKSCPSVAPTCDQSGPVLMARPSPPFAIEDVERAAHAARGQLRRQQPGLGRAAGVQRLGHRLRAEGLLQPRREGAGHRQRMGERRLVEAESAPAAAAAPKLPIVPVLCQYL